MLSLNKFAFNELNYSTAPTSFNQFTGNNATNMIRILIVADQTSLRKGLKMRLAAETDFVVLGEAHNAETAIQMAVSLCPDVVLMDIEMLQMDGLATASRIHELCPGSHIVTLSMYDDRVTRESARIAGAAAFVGKTMPANTLLSTIREVIVN